MKDRWDSGTERDSVSRSMDEQSSYLDLSDASDEAKLLRVTDPRSR
jgi:hypothetical protein